MAKITIFILIFWSIFGAEKSEALKNPNREFKYSVEENIPLRTDKKQNELSLSATAPSIARPYNLKIKLKLKDNDEPVFWNEIEKNDWNSEIKDWKFGFLNSEAKLPPFIIFKDNIFPEPNSNFYTFHKYARILLVNPMAGNNIVGRLVFFANAVKKNTPLWIYVNGQLKEKIIVTLRRDLCLKECDKFIVENIVLQPGENEIIFSETKKINRPFSSLKGNRKSPQANIRLRSDIGFEVAAFHRSTSFLPPPQFYYTADSDKLVLIKTDIFPQIEDKLLLVYRYADIALEEYPYFDFDYQIGNENKKVDVFLGIDFNQDNQIDGYLSLEELRDVNLFELARKKWQDDEMHHYPSFKIKGIFLVYRDNQADIERDSDDAEKNDFAFRLNKLIFYNNKSFSVTLAKYGVADLKIDKTNCRNYRLIIGRGDNKGQVLALSAYFPPNTAEDLSKCLSLLPAQICNSFYQKNLTYIELKLPINIARRYGQNGSNYLTFLYKLNKFNVQKVDMFLNLYVNSATMSVNKITIPWDGFKITPLKGGFQKAEINLNNFIADIRKIKWITLKFYANGVSKINERFNFYLKDNFEVVWRCPYIINSTETRRMVLSGLRSFDLPLIKIDGQEFGFSRIKNMSWDIFEGDWADLGIITLLSKNHQLELLPNSTFNIESVYLDRVLKKNSAAKNSVTPRIVFRRINSAKYEARIEGAKEPFWLVFSESFHPQWKIFLDNNLINNQFEVMKDFKELGVKEVKSELNFSPFDLRYLFAKSLTQEHFLVNLYANGWYIDPKKLGLPENFAVVIYFWPQYLFNIGVIIAEVVFIFSLIYLVTTVQISKI